MVAVVLYQRAVDRRRRESYERFCLERGLRFRHEQPGEEQRHVGTCPLFAQGHRRRWRYTISGSRRDVPFTAFEYQWTTGSGKSAHTHRIAAVLWTLAREDLPQFLLTPEGMAAKIAIFFGGQDIDFDDSPEFSRLYRLQGADESAVRALFAPDLRRTFMIEPGHHVGGAGRELMWWRNGRLPWPDALDQFLMEAERIWLVFDRG